MAAVFKFWNVPGSKGTSEGSPSHTSLELELRSEKNPVEASVDHYLQIKQAERGYLVDVTTTVQTKSKPDFLDFQLPRFRVPRFGVLGVAAGVSFPAALPWLSIAPPSGQNIAQAVPLDFACEEDGLKMAPADAQGKARLTWTRAIGNEIKITGKYLVPAGADRLRIDLPRPVNVIDHGGKVRIKVPEQLELVVGAAGWEGPAPDKHEVQMSWDAFPQSVAIGWKPYRPEFPVAGLADIWLHDRSAEVKHQLRFTLPRGVVHPALAQSAQLRLRVPAAIRDLTVVSGGQLILHEPAKEAAWVLPAGEPFAPADIVLRYDFSLPKKGGLPMTRRMVQVPLVWPEGATRHDAKVRIWSDPGTKPLLADHSSLEETWNDNGIEIVPGTGVLPALVLQGTGLNLPLVLRLVEPANTRLAPLVCDRGLIQVVVDEEGTQTYRARYLVSKLNARHLDIEFPMAAANCLLNVWLDKQKINNWEPLETVPNVAQVPVQSRLYHQPVVLEIDYKLPAGVTESKRLWRTTLCAPQFRGEVFLGQVRWQVGLPYSWVALVPGDTDYRWGVQGWLLGPEPSVTSADLESWLTKRESSDAPTPVSLAFTRAGQGSVRFWHLSRQVWLLLCSGLLLAIGLALYVLPLPRTVFWLLAVGLGIGVLAVGLLWPGSLPALVFGCEPGAR